VSEIASPVDIYFFATVFHLFDTINSPLCFSIANSNLFEDRELKLLQTWPENNQEDNYDIANTQTQAQNSYSILCFVKINNLLIQLDTTIFFDSAILIKAKGGEKEKNNSEKI
jgi:hypothetical protein